MTAPDPAMLGAMTSPAAGPNSAAVPAGELAAVGLLLDRAVKTLAAERERADRAEAELAALGSRIGAVIAQAVAAERDRIRQLADRNGAVCTGDEGTSCFFSALLEDGVTPPPESPGLPLPPHVLWHQSGGNRELYRDLLRQHGHLLSPGDEGYGDGVRWPDCGRKPEGERA